MSPQRVRFGLSGFCCSGCTTGSWGGRAVGTGGGGGGAPLRQAPGVVNGWWGWQPELPGPGKRWGEVRPPPPPKWGRRCSSWRKPTSSPPRGKRGGHPLPIRRQLLVGVGLGGDGVCGEGLHLDADLVGADGHGGFQPGGGEPGGRMPGWCTASPPGPNASPSPPQPPLPPPPPPQPHPPNPREAFAKALGAISPALDGQGTVC